MYFWMMKVLCLILNPALLEPVFFGLCFFFVYYYYYYWIYCYYSSYCCCMYSLSCYSSIYCNYSLVNVMPLSSSTFYWACFSFYELLSFLDWLTLTSSSLPWQYSLTSLCRVSKSLNTWMPRPRFKCVGFNNHKLYPSKWHIGKLYFTAVRFSKLKVLNFVIFWFWFANIVYPK